MNNIEDLLNILSKSKFRGSFHLNNKLKLYVKEKGMDTMQKHAYNIVNERLKPSFIPNDGKQTPMKQVHPVFIAQHATGTCCRKCLNRIHHIEMNKELSTQEVDYIVKVIVTWITKNS